MAMEQALPLIVATGWASGVNAYATVALMCVAQRADLIELPAAFARTDVLVVSLLLFAIEFVADKVPLVDSAWDVVQTVARPLVGGTIGALVAGEDGATALVEVGAAGGSGGLALASHSVKASIRLAVNTLARAVLQRGHQPGRGPGGGAGGLAGHRPPLARGGRGRGAAGLRRDRGAVPGQGGAGGPAPAAGAARPAGHPRRSPG